MNDAFAVVSFRDDDEDAPFRSNRATCDGARQRRVPSTLDDDERRGRTNH